MKNNCDTPYLFGDKRDPESEGSKTTKGAVWHGEIINKKKDGSLYTEDMTITPLRGDNGEIDNLIAVKMDISEKKELENMLTQSYRLESIGRLAAGIAHEINTPTQYVGDNTAFLQSSFEDLSEILGRYQDIVDAIKSSNEKTVLEDKLKKLNQAQEELDLEYLLDEIPRAFKQTMDGINRIVTVVRSMKEFSHPGSDYGRRRPGHHSHPAQECAGQAVSAAVRHGRRRTGTA